MVAMVGRYAMVVRVGKYDVVVKYATVVSDPQQPYFPSYRWL